MPHYAVGTFVPGKRGPYSFVSKDVQPCGPWAVLNTKRTEDKISPYQGEIYLFEIEDWNSLRPNSQYVKRLIASLAEIRYALADALQGAEWEQDEYGRTIGIVGKVLKTEYGWFQPYYDKGTRGNGMDESPSIWFRPCQASSENPYGDALNESLARGALFCTDPTEVDRAHQAGQCTADLGDLMREKHKV